MECDMQRALLMARSRIMSDYKNKCGSCRNFEYLIVKGKIKERGRCILKNRVDYHQASQNACKLYVESKG